MQSPAVTYSSPTTPDLITAITRKNTVFLQPGSCVSFLRKEAAEFLPLINYN